VADLYAHAALAAERRETLVAQAAEHQLRRQARSAAPHVKALPRRWIVRIKASLGSALSQAPLQPQAMESPAATTRGTSGILIRPIEPGDRALLSEGFARLSPRSRQLRFLAAKPSLSPKELAYLTDVDHRDREALVALSTTDGRGIGVARYTRDPNNRQAADVAVTVIDEWHRQGVGAELVNRLVTRAQDEGISRFTALIANENVACIRLMKSLKLDLTVLERDLQTTEYEIGLIR
jgi:RimJ/RimL family protein N-acetyltransferase